MRNLLIKELKLCASPLSYLFVLFGMMFFLPGYPVLCGAFFVSMGIFQSFRNTREANDILFSVLLPVAKKDVVKGKYLFVCVIEAAGLFVMSLAVIFRMTVFSESSVYRENALMNANMFALGMAFVIFGLFNAVFVGGFFKTAVQFGRPFILFTIVAFAVLGAAEALHYIPGFDAVNAFGTEDLLLQTVLLLGGMLFYGSVTLFACKRACKHFEKIDL